jgi:hypothetical protein
VVVVTDGVDCSLTSSGLAAFDPDGQRALWSDSDAELPTAAVCWNAGVQCQGDPAGFDDCMAVDRGLDGQLAAEGEPPVLVPVAEFERLVADELQLHVISGVPAAGGAEPVYSASGDPAWLLEHGIDPGCTDGDVSALPPVRLRDLAAELSSACASEYGEFLAGLPGGELPCIRPCDAAELRVDYEAPGQEPVAAPECERSGVTLDVPPGATACHVLVPDAPGCADDPERTVGLVLRAADREQTPAFVLTPDPWANDGSCGG